MKSQWDGIYTVAQASRGDALYKDMCSECHGDALRGASFGPPLIGQKFAVEWDHRSLAELADVIRTKMPANAPGTLTGPQAADLLAFILHKGDYPAGAQELPADGGALETYRFLGTKPAEAQ